MFRLGNKQMELFIPPTPSIATIALAKLITPTVLSVGYNCVETEYRHEEIVRFQRMKKSPVILVPNHPAKSDPVVMFDLAKRVKQQFYFLSNREQFGRECNWYGTFLKCCGAYSIARGVADFESFKTTRRLLAEESAKIAIFPEGGNHSRNDKVFPFQEGVFRLALQAQHQMNAQGNDGPLYIQPVALQYVSVDVESDEVLDQAIEDALQALEQALELKCDLNHDRRTRIRFIGKAMVTRGERHERLKTDEAKDIHPRMDCLLEHMLLRINCSLGNLNTKPNKIFKERVQDVVNVFHGRGFEGVEAETVYDRRLAKEQFQRMQLIRLELDRLLNWTVVEPGYLQDYPSRERIIDTIHRMEREVFGFEKLNVKKKCVIRLGEPFDLRVYKSENPSDKRRNIELATQRAEQTVQNLLKEMNV